MFVRILTFVLLLTLCGHAAQAGVMAGIDWDSGSAMSASDSDTLPPESPIGFGKGSPLTSMGDSVSNHSTTSSTAVYSAIDFIAFEPNLIGYIRLVDRSLPPTPVLDGLLKPS